MSYRLIDANAIQIEFPKVNELPCIYVDLPNGLDNSYHFISTDGINITHEQIEYEKGYRDGYASAIKVEPDSCEYWDSESHFCALHRPQAESIRHRKLDAIKHRRWIDRGYMKVGFNCSVCGAYVISGKENYCPNCGARMDEVK